MKNLNSKKSFHPTNKKIKEIKERIKQRIYKDIKLKQRIYKRINKN